MAAYPPPPLTHIACKCSIPIYGNLLESMHALGNCAWVYSSYMSAGVSARLFPKPSLSPGFLPLPKSKTGNEKT